MFIAVASEQFELHDLQQKILERENPALAAQPLQVAGLIRLQSKKAYELKA